MKIVLNTHSSKIRPRSEYCKIGVPRECKRLYSFSTIGVSFFEKLVVFIKNENLDFLVWFGLVFFALKIFFFGISHFQTGI